MLALAEKGEITLKSAITNDAMAEQLDSLVSMQRLRVSDIDGAVDRMDWNSSYAKPDRRMMTDNSGSGFLVTLNFANNLQSDINRGRVGSLPIATARQALEVGKYKLNRMWNAAAAADRAAALKASSSTPVQLKRLGLDLKVAE